MRVPPLRALPCTVTAALVRMHRATVSGGCPPLETGARSNILKDAQAFAFSLAASLMVAIVVFRAGDGSLSVVPANEFDGDEAQILVEIDPFAA